jgi:hypothetical protein
MFSQFIFSSSKAFFVVDQGSFSCRDTLLMVNERRLCGLYPYFVVGQYEILLIVFNLSIPCPLAGLVRFTGDISDISALLDYVKQIGLRKILRGRSVASIRVAWITTGSLSPSSAIIQSLPSSRSA